MAEMILLFDDQALNPDEIVKKYSGRPNSVRVALGAGYRGNGNFR